MRKFILALVVIMMVFSPVAASLADTDGDLYTDSFENAKGTDPNDANSKPQCCGGSGAYSDSDSFIDGAELASGTDPYDSSDYPDDGIPGGSVDSDGDGVYDQEEHYMYGTDITNTDTDGDGVDDYTEIKANCCDDPNQDNDGDGCTNNQEFIDRTDLNDPKSYGDCGMQGGAYAAEGGYGSWPILILVGALVVGLVYWHYKK